MQLDPLERSGHPRSTMAITQPAAIGAAPTTFATLLVDLKLMAADQLLANDNNTDVFGQFVCAPSPIASVLLALGCSAPQEMLRSPAGTFKSICSLGFLPTRCPCTMECPCQCSCLSFRPIASCRSRLLQGKSCSIAITRSDA
ncbi:hypothetical protein AMAG_19177 [Allomyces macrogynus ATCC 38327]|uniref:Uncharacterized protein n=1 Tax=Allomyces macrogynus (strain ATCC 38327) TaxID=578462 RepID=A0A0L0SPU3_ALLM3|nr:hypothetical protein AMAG_19177 [Allomyces macrogynus ATCC 38327]|eukprot:KNE64511.1 hypothetical protein AMAG_19177 [Allomyces macrogynus ATCC 38327]